MARPRKTRSRVKWEYDRVKALASLLCTVEEICNFFGIPKEIGDVEYLENSAFKEAVDSGYSEMRLGLRRMQMATAEAGNVAMQIFLGKNYLNQSDVQNHVLKGSLDLRDTERKMLQDLMSDPAALKAAETLFEKYAERMVVQGEAKVN